MSAPSEHEPDYRQQQWQDEYEQWLADDRDEDEPDWENGDDE